MKRYFFTAIGVITLLVTVMFAFNVIGCEVGEKDVAPVLEPVEKDAGEPVETDDAILLEEINVDTLEGQENSDVEKAVEVKVGPDVASFDMLRCRVYSQSAVCGANHWMYAGRRLAMVQGKN
jgi:hypothetical protein